MNTPEGMTLDPCPFCGGEAEFERVGTPRQSCIVACRNCGARHESSDEDEHSGSSWNSRAASVPTPPEQQCGCGDRPASLCPGEWEPGCDFGANEKYVRVSRQPPPEQPAAQGELTDWPKPALLVDCAQGFVEGWTRSQVKAVIAADRAARKRPEAEVTGIMEAVDTLMDAQAGFVDGQARYSGARVDAAYAEVERLVRGEKA